MKTFLNIHPIIRIHSKFKFNKLQKIIIQFSIDSKTKNTKKINDNYYKLNRIKSLKF